MSRKPSNSLLELRPIPVTWEAAPPPPGVPSRRPKQRWLRSKRQKRQSTNCRT